jgi:hypothetical protein
MHCDNIQKKILAAGTKKCRALAAEDLEKNT